ncbi:MAG: hypothetical protein K6E70_09565, partial [Butyrivibrio sp.]|nr:hypothetical protein [Butyrivibrio sp.]
RSNFSFFYPYCAIYLFPTHNTLPFVAWSNFLLLYRKILLPAAFIPVSKGFKLALVPRVLSLLWFQGLKLALGYAPY